jgi:protein-S-isoprenylcysteine O-methyltransferase Ste14
VRKETAAAVSAAFFALAPGVSAGAVPWLLTRWHVREPLPYWPPLRLAGVALITVGVLALAHAFARFVVEGRGTPAPIAPPAHLVVGGLYRYVRNPMYLAVAATIVGQALALGQLVLLGYAAIVCVTVVAFAHGYEEPTLSRQFGVRYETYRRAVPAWCPRRRPWIPPDLHDSGSTAVRTDGREIGTRRSLRSRRSKPA